MVSKKLANPHVSSDDLEEEFYEELSVNEEDTQD